MENQQNQRLLRQREAAANWAESKWRGTIAAGTGWGKTKCAVVDCVELLMDYLVDYDKDRGVFKPVPKTLIVVIREEHRDITWPNELKTFESKLQVGVNCDIICWASLTKTDLTPYNLIILDEVHHVTEDTYNHLSMVDKPMLGLSATPPHESDKAYWIQSLCPVCYVYGLEKGVVETINAPYMLHIIKIGMDDRLRDIKAGTKAKPFMTTEKAQMAYLDSLVQKEMIKKGGGPVDFSRDWRVSGAIRKRKDAIYNSRSKRIAAVHLMRKVYRKGKRLLVFGGSIEQIEQMTNGQFTYHSENKKLDRLGQFCRGESDILVTVGMVDEGSNLPSPDFGVIIQTTASQRRMVQRIGRMVRYRPNYRAELYLLCLSGSQDESWVDQAIAGLPNYRFKIFKYDHVDDFKKTDEWMIQPAPPTSKL